MKFYEQQINEFKKKVIFNAENDIDLRSSNYSIENLHVIIEQLLLKSTNSLIISLKNKNLIFNEDNLKLLDETIERLNKTNGQIIIFNWMNEDKYFSKFQEFDLKYIFSKDSFNNFIVVDNKSYWLEDVRSSNRNSYLESKIITAEYNFNNKSKATEIANLISNYER